MMVTDGEKILCLRSETRVMNPLPSGSLAWWSTRACADVKDPVTKSRSGGAPELLDVGGRLQISQCIEWLQQQ